MSTKIHHGYLAAAGTDPFALIGALNAAADETARTIQIEQIAACAATIIDRRRVAALDPETVGFTASTPELDEYAPVVTATTNVWLAGTKAGASNLRSHWDLSCEVCFVAHPDDPERHLVLVYAQHDRLATALVAAGRFELYDYFDTTDRPAHVDEHEWAERARVWDAALGYDTPAERGLSWSHTPLPVRPDVDEVAAVLPATRVRARSVAGFCLDKAVVNASDINYSRIIDEVNRLVPLIEPHLSPIDVDDLAGVGHSPVGSVR